MKKRCFKCPAMAVWYYAPTPTANDSYYCDACVHRGCSCNLIAYGDEEGSSDEQFKDDQGRLLPCCEYDYDQNGFEDESANDL